jgi:hypothetical protein
MALTKKAARQCPIVATCDFTYADLTSGAYAAMIDLPVNAIVTSGDLAITTLFNSATTDQFSIGDKVGSAAATATTYSAQSADVTATGRAALVVPIGKKMTSAGSVGVVWTGAGAAPSAGVGRLVISYIVDGRAEFTEG